MGLRPDYVVVGAGAAGSALAGRLASGGASVVLLEAGGVPSGETVRMPRQWMALLGGEYDWGWSTEPQPGLGGRSIVLSQGKGLGGGSAINALGWTRGARADYDGWEQAGARGWGADAVAAIYRRIEDSPRGTRGGVAAADRGVGGPIPLSDVRGKPPLRDELMAAAQTLLGFTIDVNAQQMGADTIESMVRDGGRCTVADAYLPADRRPAGLTVLTGARATRVVFEGSRAVGVACERDGGTEVVEAAHEVVLAAGALATPHLLLLSGIGPAAELAEAGVELVADVPGVGRDLHDHLRIAVPFALTERGRVVAGSPSAEEEVARWRSRGDGPCADPGPMLVAFANTRTPRTAPPDVELIAAMRPGESPLLALVAINLQPASRGRVWLRSADPAEPPRVDPAYLADPRDVETLVRGVRLIGELAGTSPLAALLEAPPPDAGAGATDAQVAAYVRAQAGTMFHPVGSVRMGAADDPGAVLDHRLRVRGVQRLRVADSSAMPTTIRGHTMAPSVLIGHHASELLIEDRSGYSDERGACSASAAGG